MHEFDDTRLERARRQLRLIEARSEFAEARAERLLSLCAVEAAEVRREGGCTELLERHVMWTRSRLEAERTLQDELEEAVDLSIHVERYVNRLIVSSPSMTELRTSTASVMVAGEFCRWIMVIAAELLYVIETSAHPVDGCRASIRIWFEQDRGLSMRVVSLDGAERPMPSRSGYKALTRTRRLMAHLGEFTQRIDDDGDLTYELLFPGVSVNPAR